MDTIRGVIRIKRSLAHVRGNAPQTICRSLTVLREQAQEAESCIRILLR
jgi:hypothetical protein